MTARDRLVLVLVCALAICGAGWFMLVKPERQEAAKLAGEVAAEQTRLSGAQAAVAAAEAARARYATDYATVARLGKAIPADDDVASLVFQLEATADAHHVDFRAVKSSAAGGAAAPPVATPAEQVASANAAGEGTKAQDDPAAGTPATQAAAASAPAGTPVGVAGLPTLPFSFTFDGSYKNMRSFLGALDDLTVVKKGDLVIRGRLLTIDSVSLKESREGFPLVQAEVQATAYLVPPTEGLTAGATPQGPAAATPAAASPAPPASGSSTPAPPTAAVTGGLR